MNKNKFIKDSLDLIKLYFDATFVGDKDISEERILTSLKYTLFDFRKMLMMNKKAYKIKKQDRAEAVKYFKSIAETICWGYMYLGKKKFSGSLEKRADILNWKQSLNGKKKKPLKSLRKVRGYQND